MNEVKKTIAAIVFIAALIVGIMLIGGLTGCTTKTRSVELAGMYASEAGTLAIGSIDVMATPTGEESAFVKYEEDNAWLAPSMKLHGIKIMLTGTNSVDKVDAVVEHICGALGAARKRESETKSEEPPPDK